MRASVHSVESVRESWSIALMSKDARLVMFGTGDFALPTFLHLHHAGYSLVALVTQPDRPQGRKQERIASPIKQAAIERGIAVLQPESVNSDEAIAEIQSLRPDLFVTAAYGQILSARLLSVPRLGGVNLHGSVLPAYRGAAPVARAIQQGERESGVTVILMNPRVDAGGMIHVARTPIQPDETAGQLEDRLAVLGAPLVSLSVDEIAAGTATVSPQDRGKVTRAPKLRKEDGRIDWNQSAQAVHDLVRAMQPWPGADSYLHRQSRPNEPPQRLIVHATRVATEPTSVSHEPPGTVTHASQGRLLVATAAGVVAITTVQVVGKKPMTAADFLRGHSIQPGDRFGPP